jgi:hypothetical protein
MQRPPSTVITPPFIKLPPRLLSMRMGPTISCGSPPRPEISSDAVRLTCTGTLDGFVSRICQTRARVLLDTSHFGRKDAGENSVAADLESVVSVDWSTTHGANLPARSLPICKVAAYHQPSPADTHLGCTISERAHRVLVQHTRDRRNDDHAGVGSLAQERDEGGGQKVDTCY